MATGIHKYTVQEAVNPYTRAVVGDGTDMAESKGIYVKAGGELTMTIGGEAVVFTGLLTGTIYPLAVTKATSDVILLY